MSIMLADIDATCASLGYYDGKTYVPEPNALHGLKHLIWVLRRDGDTHEYRRHMGHGKVLQTDLIPMLTAQTEENETSDALLRLLVNLTTPALLLYNETLPKDGPNRRNFLHLLEILQSFKTAFSNPAVWISLRKRFQKVLEIDSVERTEEKGLLIERVLVLIRNVLHVPSNPDVERRADNDASLHDQVLWALQEAGILDLILYIIGSEYENQYHLHAMEIICLMYREQMAESLADVSLQRTAAEKSRDEQDLIAARKRERAKVAMKPPTGRHSRFGGTYIMQNMKSVSDRDIICHKPLDRAVAMDFDRDKNKQKKSHRMAKDEQIIERRSALSIRLFLRQFAIELLQSAFNNMVRQVRRTLDRGTTGNDDSYLLWVIRFFLEFNRLNGFKIPLVSEALSTQNFHWVLGRVQHHLDMLTSDKQNIKLWERRLSIAIQTLKELFKNLVTLQTMTSEDARALFKLLLNNVCYVLEFRETVLHTLTSYNENRNTKTYMRDVVETTHIFFKLMEKFCNGNVVVQDKKKSRAKGKKAKKPQKSANQHGNTPNNHDDDDNNEDAEDKWAVVASEVAAVLSSDSTTLPEEDHPLPFDAASEKPLEDQKDDCMVRIHGFLHQSKFEHAVLLLRSAREVWPQSDCFGSENSQPEDELLLLRDIFMTNLNSGTENLDDDKTNTENGTAGSDVDNDEDDSDEGNEDARNTEVEFRFDDFLKRLVNPKVVQACTVVLTDWERLPARIIKSAVTILHRIAFGCKVPIMLFQVSLFRIFQQVFGAPRDVHHDEIRRLGVYVMRCFTEIAKTNPKVYAELFFYKSVREANDIEYGYDDARYANANNKKIGWTEEQEDELRQLFMENQNNPSTEKDVIDWILDNLIDKHRTRRAVIKKMKELGLIFKAPTRKSVAAAVSKHLWRYEEDVLLRELYDTYRLEDDCLAKIMETFVDKRSKNATIKRMIELGLIAERSEILPTKRKRSRQSQPNGEGDGSGSDSSDSDEDDEHDSRPVRVTIMNTKKQEKASKPKQQPTRELPKIMLNVIEIQSQIAAIDDSLKTHFDWLQESLNDAAEDADDTDDLSDPSDGVPLVPFSMTQKEAMENPQFKKLLQSLGLQEPLKEMETYWRIPVNMAAKEMRLAAKLLGGEPIENIESADADDDFERLYVSDSEDESFTEIEKDRQNRLQRANELIYNDSDNEEEQRPALKPTNQAKKPKGGINLFDMVKDGTEQMDQDDESASNDGQNTTTAFDSEEFNSQVIRRRLAQLEDSDSESDSAAGNGVSGKATNNDESEKEGEETFNSNKRERSVPEAVATMSDDDDPIVAPQKKRAKISIIDDDDDDD
ncbi:protein timeless homolog [Sitodiplosis mosellana]|uniref:protein timeless homolog n=1 Tax=Sitodiplosis mosellana TaxID=263140 RepID=UPI0024452BF6|nr:protein timeless homolog [Sitodiplosis mosellana]